MKLVSVNSVIVVLVTYFLVTLLSFVWVLACYLYIAITTINYQYNRHYTSIISYHLVSASKTTASFHRRLATFTVTNVVTDLMCSTFSIPFAGITTVPCLPIIPDAIPAYVAAFIRKTVATPTAGHRFHTTIIDATFI